MTINGLENYDLHLGETISLTIGGVDVVNYSFYLNTPDIGIPATWSADIPVATPITFDLDNLGNYTLSVIGIDSAGNRQDANPTVLTWTAVNPAFIFGTKAELEAGIDAWLANEADATSIYGEINTWDVSNITDMMQLFSQTKGRGTFNDGDISNWDVSNVTTMNQMFDNNKVFNQPIGNWDTGNVNDMMGVFMSAFEFNQDISSWNTSNVTTMSIMFNNARKFNQPIGDWNVSNVTQMNSMFRSAYVLTNQ